MELPCAMRRLRVPRPLLIHVRAGVGEHAVVPLRVKPRHRERRGAARAAAHRRAAVGIRRERHVEVVRDLRQHFLLDELGVEARHGVVLEAALAALRVAAARVDHDRDHRGHAFRGDQVVEDRRQERRVRAHAVLRDEERRGRAARVLFRNVDDDLALVRDDSFLTLRDAGINFAVLGIHRELVHLTFRHVVARDRFGRVRVVGPDRELDVVRRARGRGDGADRARRGLGLGRRRSGGSVGRVHDDR